MKNCFFKEKIENADLYRDALNKTISTHELTILYSFKNNYNSCFEFHLDLTFAWLVFTFF